MKLKLNKPTKITKRFSVKAVALMRGLGAIITKKKNKIIKNNFNFLDKFVYLFSPFIIFFRILGHLKVFGGQSDDFSGIGNDFATALESCHIGFMIFVDEYVYFLKQIFYFSFKEFYFFGSHKRFLCFIKEEYNKLKKQNNENWTMLERFHFYAKAPNG